MDPDTVYDLCLPILEDPAINEDDKPDKLEHLVKKELGLDGKALEDAVLGSLWRHRAAGSTSVKVLAPIRTTAARRPSPAPWQLQRSTTPLSASTPRSLSTSSRMPPNLSLVSPSHKRPLSFNSASSSPKPSPHLAYASPYIPHSPSLNAYRPADIAAPPSFEDFTDFGSEHVDWLVSDDASSNTSLADTSSSTLPENSESYMAPYTVNMTPYDMLRSVLRDERTDQELDAILEANGYDLSQTIAALLDQSANIADDRPQQPAIVAPPTEKRGLIIGKSMSPTFRPLTPASQAKSSVACRYWISTGSCARADCRFSHDLDNQICKYWLSGSCLAGDSCIFSHDPSALMLRLTLDESHSDSSSQLPPPPPDDDSFPSLQRTISNPYEAQEPDTTLLDSSKSHYPVALNPALANFVPSGLASAATPSMSRTSSFQDSTSTTPAWNDDDAFPTLGSASGKSGKRHHGKRGHGHGAQHKEVFTPSSLADVVRLSPSPGPQNQERHGLKTQRSNLGSRVNNAAALAIPPPEHIPWLETGDGANTAYLKFRAEAFRHGGLRNKFLQSAAQAWNRNDARGAKVLSLRGQNENALMKEAHREAARSLYAERNSGLASAPPETFIDLHGLHPEEAVEYLIDALGQHASSSRPLYAICGTGHHSKNGRDKVGKAIRAYLADCRYAFREFSVPGDRNNVGGILGIDPRSSSTAAALGGEQSPEADSGIGLLGPEDTKVRLVSAAVGRKT